MGIDSQAVGNASPAHRIAHNGHVYEFRLVDQALKADWEKALYQQACDAAGRLAAIKPEGWHESKLVELDDEFLSGGFSFLSSRSVKALKEPHGMALFLSLLTGKELLDLAPLLKAKGAEVKAKLHLVLKESFPGFSGDEGPNG